MRNNVIIRRCESQQLASSAITSSAIGPRLLHAWKKLIHVKYFVQLYSLRIRMELVLYFIVQMSFGEGMPSFHVYYTIDGRQNFVFCQILLRFESIYCRHEDAKVNKVLHFFKTIIKDSICRLYLNLNLN